MHKLKLTKAENFFPTVKELLKTGINVCITVTGMSMYPFLRENIDRVELSTTSFPKIHSGDIVLILRDSGEYVLHRVWKKEKDCFYIVGDAQQWIEGPLKPEQLIAMVTYIWRNNRKLNCSSYWWQLLSSTWLKLLPYRYFIFKACNKLKKFINQIIKVGI